MENAVRNAKEWAQTTGTRIIEVKNSRLFMVFIVVFCGFPNIFLHFDGKYNKAKLFNLFLLNVFGIYDRRSKQYKVFSVFFRYTTLFVPSLLVSVIFILGAFILLCSAFLWILGKNKFPHNISANEETKVKTD